MKRMETLSLGEFFPSALGKIAQWTLLTICQKGVNAKSRYANVNKCRNTLLSLFNSKNRYNLT